MSDVVLGRGEVETEILTQAVPLVFISHDTRDADLAEAFSKLLRSVSAGMIKTFRSSDKKGKEGIDFGEEWYKRLMERLQTTSDVVCLFTERSLDRPWLLFEAGVAKGRLNTPVIGIALGVPLGRVTAGPFYQFQNMEDSELDLIKLVQQLAKRIPGLELDDDVVKIQVHAFIEAKNKILLALAGGKKNDLSIVEETSFAKLIEEMKTLPARVVERFNDLDASPQTKKSRSYSAVGLDEMMHLSMRSGEPAGLLIAASFFRDDLPWLYELTLDIYRVVRSGSLAEVREEIVRFDNVISLLSRYPILERFPFANKEAHYVAREFPRFLREYLRRAVDQKRPRRKMVAKAAEE